MNRRTILSVLCLASLAAPIWCAETPVAQADPPPATAQDNSTVNATDLETLKERIAAQQEQIKKLQQAMDEQQKLLERSLQTLSTSAKAPTATTAATTTDGTSLVEAATTSNVANPVRLISALGGARQDDATPSTSPCNEGNPSPTFIRLGNVCIVPIGFMDLTGLWRDKNAGSSIGSNFGSIPYNNTTNSKNSEFRFSPQNSRIGFRIDGDWKGTHFIGYNEFDFLGTSGATNLTVTNGAFVPRLRLFWVDVRKGKVEFLAGQSWSMLTPNRSGISALPGDLFYSQVMDVNYMAGLTWTRQPGVRVLFHPSEKVTFGLSFENPDQYMGGANGSGAATLPTGLPAPASGTVVASPAGLQSLAGSQLDNGGAISLGVATTATTVSTPTGTTTINNPTVTAAANTVLSTPTVAPDIIAKLAFDPTSRFHFEVAGIESQFKVFNTNSGSAPGAGQHFSTTGAGVLVGLNAAITKGFRLISTNFWNDGEGRYIFGQAPDVILRANGSLSALHSASTVDGFEATFHKTLLFAYYGGIFIGRDVTTDVSGKLVGYGFTGSSNGQNRSVQEGTFGFNQTMWKNPRYGAINLIGQYEYASRDPWAVAANAPRNTHDNTVYIDVRYTLPGSTPKF